MNTNRQTKARIQPKRNKETAESAENSYAIMLQDGKNKRLIADLQSNISENCTLLSTVHMAIISGLADMICNTISQYYRCANDWIPKKQN